MILLPLGMVHTHYTHGAIPELAPVVLPLPKLPLLPLLPLLLPLSPLLLLLLDPICYCCSHTHTHTLPHLLHALDQTSQATSYKDRRPWGSACACALTPLGIQVPVCPLRCHWWWHGASRGRALLLVDGTLCMLGFAPVPPSTAPGQVPPAALGTHACNTPTQSLARVTGVRWRPPLESCRL